MGRKPPKKQPRETRGLTARREQYTPSGVIGSMNPEQRASRTALKRQQLVAADEPAVEGSLRPPEIRARAKKPRSYTNDAAHGETIGFPPSEKTQRQRKIGY